MKDQRSFGEYLHSRRNKAGLTIRELSALSGLNISVLCNLELGNHAPRLHAIEKLAAAFGQTVPIFLRWYYKGA